MRKWITSVVALFVFAILAGCGNDSHEGHDHKPGEKHEEGEKGK